MLFLKTNCKMRMNMNSMGLALCCILALYGLIVLIRKMMSTDKDKKWFSENEQYRVDRYVAQVDCSKGGCTYWD